MFHVYGVHGRVFSGSLEQLRQQLPVTSVSRVRRIAPEGEDADQGAGRATAPPPGSQGAGREAVLAYAPDAGSHVRQPLTQASDVMSRPAFTVPADVSLREAWRVLAERGIGQAPVIDASGVLVGLIGRAELMPFASLDMPGVQADQARLALPVREVMWTPVPSAAPDTDLRRVAALLLDTGQPGLPVADGTGRVLGFVSRTDLLRALATDPPLDLWS